jgi:sugar phosphate permease
MSSSQSKFHYGWVVVTMTVLVLLAAAGVRSAPGVMLVPIQIETGWSRAIISFAVSMGLFVFGLSSPLSGALIARLGARLIMMIGLAVIGVSLLISSTMTATWQMTLFWGVLSGLGTGLAGSVIGAAVANRWFVQRRGLVVGMFGAATSAGQLMFIPLLTQWTNSMGWRSATVILAALAIGLIVPVFLLMSDDPSKRGLLPYGAPADYAATASTSAGQGVMRMALRSTTFWLLVATFFVCGFSSNGIIGTHLISYAIDCGIPNTTAAGLLAVMGTMNFIGTLASGWLTDRYDPRKLLAIYYSLRGLSLLLLPFVNEPTGLTVFAIFFGLDYIATVPPTTALAADTFGRKNVGIVYGWIFCAHQIGAALASWLGGALRDSLNAYTVPFLLAGLLAIAAGMLALRIRRNAPQVQFA